MIEGLKPYPEYQETGLQWLAQTPSHWRLSRTKSFLTEVDERSTTGEEQLLSLRMHIGLIPHDEVSDKPIPPEDLVGYKKTRPGDLVVNRMRASIGLIACTPTSGIVSPGYAVFRVRPEVSTEYIVQLFKTPLMGGKFRAESKGLGTGSSGFLRLYSESLGNISVPVPPEREQQLILRFLDHVDRKIRRYIAAKRRLIELLNEQKQAIIHRAVTRGLDPNVRLKPSGVEWLGEVPEGWEIWRLSHFSRVGNGSTPSRSNSSYWKNGINPWLNSSCANRSTVTEADQFVTETALRECHLPKVPSGSVLVAITGQGKTRGKATVLSTEATINQHLAYVIPRAARVSARFLQVVLTGAYPELRRISDDAGSTKGALTCADLKRFRVALPPRSEQDFD